MARKYNNRYNGIINVYKEKDYTSHDVVAIVKRITGSKAGHTGALDPNAEGILPICLGKSTRLSDFIMGGDKQYKAELILGAETDTYDMVGKIINQKEVTSTEQEIIDTVNSFVGAIMQVPPMYSAIKIKGKKLYEIARKGETIERPARQVHIHNIEILDFSEQNKILLLIDCGKGTYIRSLCHDIGEKLGCGGHMGELTRTKSGNFRLDDSYKLNEIEKLHLENRLDEIIIPPDKILSKYKATTIDEKANNLLYNGNKVSTEYACGTYDFSLDEEILVYDYDNKFIGLFTVVEGKNGKRYFKPKIML